MSTSLNTIISTIKTVALANGFTSVEELKLNMESNADTLLPKLFIKVNGINYSNLLVDTALEEYKLELTIVIADSDNPISDLKALIDTLLNQLFKQNTLFNTLVTNDSIELTGADLTNERDVYAKLGGESVTLKMNIKNINVFGGTPCY